MRSIFAAALLVSFVPAVHGADDENPYRNAKVGDWVEYKMTGAGFEGKTKMTIVAKDDKELTFEIASTFTAGGKEMTGPLQKQTIDLTKKYDPVKDGIVKENGVDVKFEKLGEGEEKIKFGDKEFDTKWTKTKTTSTVNNITIVSEFKMWFCKDVPLSGLVRMDTTVQMTTTKLELIGLGKK
jgi:hypothetical protein